MAERAFFLIFQTKKIIIMYVPKIILEYQKQNLPNWQKNVNRHEANKRNPAITMFW